jgi:MinD-like ATPase involved in chromosome partitioning or flagellar assembly
MIVAVWAVRGGSGVSTASALLIRSLMSRGDSREPVVAIDADGDLPALFGIAPGSGEGLSDWLGADPSVGADALDGLLIGGSVNVLPLGLASPVDRITEHVDDTRLDLALTYLTAHSSVVCDLGHTSAPLHEALIARAHRSILVIRPCMLSVRTALRSPRPAHGMVVVGSQPGDMRTDDLESALGIPVLATIPPLPALARAVNRSGLSGRLPYRAMRALTPVVQS